MSNYSRGRVFEYRVKKYFEDKGCFVVRSAGSKGAMDLAVFPFVNIAGISKPLFVQCKIKHGAISPDERNGLVDVALKHGGIAVVVTRAKKGHDLSIICLSPYDPVFTP